jgi:hypothetical protein
MVRVIYGKEFDTEKSKVIKKNTVGAYGDPAGYEETLYVTSDGNYFLYTNGGKSSLYPKEKIKRMSYAAVKEWIKNK